MWFNLGIKNGPKRRAFGLWSTLVLSPARKLWHLIVHLHLCSILSVIPTCNRCCQVWQAEKKKKTLVYEVTWDIGWTVKTKKHGGAHGKFSLKDLIRYSNIWWSHQKSHRPWGQCLNRKVIECKTLCVKTVPTRERSNTDFTLRGSLWSWNCLKATTA